MNPAYCLNIRFQNKIKKFPLRQKYSLKEFFALIANCFNIKPSEKNLILKDSNGNTFDISSWLVKPREGFPKILNLTLEESIYIKTSNKSASKHEKLYKIPNNFNKVSQKSHSSPSKLLKDISKLQLSIGLIQNLPEFEEKFLTNNENYNITLILFFDDFSSAYSNLLRYHGSLIRNHEMIDFFYCVTEEFEKSYFRERYMLKRPFFVVFHGINKFLEMRLNLSEEDFEEMMQKIQKETESSLNESSARSESQEGFLNIEEFDAKTAFLDYVQKMMESGIIDDLQYYYLKCLFLENDAEFKQMICPYLKNKDYEHFIEEIKEFLHNYHSNSEQKIYNIDEEEENDENDVYLLKESENAESFYDIEDFNVKEVVIKIIRERIIGENEQKLLIKMIKENDEIILSCLDMYENSRDEEDLIDTLQRIFKKFKGSMKQNFFMHENPVNNMQEETKQKKLEEKPITFLKKTKEVNNNQNEITHKITEIINKPLEIIKRISLKSFDLKMFLDKNQEKLSNEEYGLILCMERNCDEELKAIVYQCQNLKNQELVFKLLKSLAETKLIQFLIKTFESKEIQYIEKFKKSKNSPIFQAFLSFKQSQNLEELQSSLLSIVYSQGLRKTSHDAIEIGRLPQTQPQKPQIQPLSTEKNVVEKKTSYASMAMDRKIQRSNSQKEIKFEMVLRKGTTLEEIEMKNSQSQKSKENDPFRISVGQKEMNSGFEKVINSFYEQQHLNKFNEIYRQMIAECHFLDEASKKRLDSLFIHSDFGLLAVLNNYERKRSAEKIKKDILNLLEKEVISYEMDEGSPMMRSKIQNLNNMKHILTQLVKNHLITPKQMKLFVYLYLAEDICILSAYEVFLETDDQLDMVENLMLINKSVFFQTRLDFDEIEQFDESILTQLSMLYAFKKYLNINERVTLEKMIRAGDDFLIKTSKEYTDNFNKQNFIGRIKEYANKKAQELMHVEKILKEQHQIAKENNPENYKEIIMNFGSQKFLKDVNIGFLKKLVDVNHYIINPIFKVYEMTKDKEDFLENIKLTYKVIYKETFMNIVDKYAGLYRWTEEKEIKLKKTFESHDKILMGAYEVFIMFFDEDAEKEFADTANRFLKIK